MQSEICCLFVANEDEDEDRLEFYNEFVEKLVMEMQVLVWSSLITFFLWQCFKWTLST